MLLDEEIGDALNLSLPPKLKSREMLEHYARGCFLLYKAEARKRHDFMWPLRQALMQRVQKHIATAWAA